MKHLKIFETEFFGAWGFAGLKDYAGTVLGLKLFPFFKLQILGTMIGGLMAFVATWIWNPPGGAALIVFMTFVNARYGYLVSKKIRNVGWKWDRFNRTLSIVASDIFLMALLHWAIHFYPYYAPLADILFGWFFGNKFRQIIYHMALLKLQEGGLANYFRKFLIKILNQKIGGEMVDNLQHKNKEDGIE